MLGSYARVALFCTSILHNIASHLTPKRIILMLSWPLTRPLPCLREYVYDIVYFLFLVCMIGVEGLYNRIC